MDCGTRNDQEGSMTTKLNVAKAIQAAAKLLQFERGRMSRLRLLKLLYIADRRCVKETGRQLIGDRVVAMDNGPLHGTVYNMIKGQSVHDRAWSMYIRQDGPRDVQLHCVPGNSELSRHEIELLDSVSTDHMKYDEWEIVDFTHQFAEYKKADATRTHGRSVLIPFEDVIDGVQRSGDKDSILQDIADDEAFDEFFKA